MKGTGSSALPIDEERVGRSGYQRSVRYCPEGHPNSDTSESSLSTDSELLWELVVCSTHGTRIDTHSSLDKAKCMQNLNVSPTPRRSSRVPVAVPIMVTSLEPGIHFSEVCETSVVNAHGCAMQSRVKLDTGTTLHLHSKDGRETTAQVVSCQPVGSNNESWRLGARLDRPENFWGLPNCPKDWLTLPVGSDSARLSQTRAATSVKTTRPGMSGEDVKRIIAESVRPLQAELAALKENLTHKEAKRSRFEVSLSSIPPELEEQLELKVKKDLGPKVLDETRQQSTQLLAAARASIEQRTNQAYQDFVRRVGEELQAVEQRAQDNSAKILENLQEHLRSSVEDFQQNVVDGGSRLKRLSDELLQSLQHSLNEQHNTRRAELEQVRAAVASESSRLQERVEHLNRRITDLDQSARTLESGLDKRLSEMASNTVRNMRGELESAADTILKNSTTRNVQALDNQLEDACRNMKIIEKGIVASVSESLKSQAEDASRVFERSMEDLAKLSLERWRTTLAAGLSAVVKNLGEQFQLQASAIENDGNH